MRRTAISILLLSLSLYLLASGFSGLKVTMTDGSSVAVSLSEKPVVTFNGDKLIIKSTASTTEFERAKVVRFNYVESSSVETININNNTLTSDGESLSFTNLCADSKITIHDVSGKLIKSATATGDYKIKLTDLTAGVYIVSVNGISTKIAVKR